jgi:hypothetical protein
MIFVINGHMQFLNFYSVTQEKYVSLVSNIVSAVSDFEKIQVTASAHGITTQAALSIIIIHRLDSRIFF